MPVPHSMRTAAAGLTAAGVLLVAAPSALADTRVALESGNFGSGIAGTVLTVRDQRDVFHDERLSVAVTRRLSGRWQVVAFAREALAGNGCQRESRNVVTCNPVPIDGIFFEGSKFNDVLNNNTGVDSRMEGRAGNDILDGGDASDFLLGEAGNDEIAGQIGSDTALYGSAGGPVVVTIDGINNDGGIAEDDNVRVDTENVSGTQFADVLIGSDQPNVITGGGGNDRIDARGGNDTLREGEAPSGADDLRGGDGIDTITYLGRTTGVNVRLNGLPDDGNTIDDPDANGRAGDNVSEIENVTGSDRPDFIRGDDGPNRIDGNGGADNVQALGGNDTVTGHADRDAIEGGPGDDTLDGDASDGPELQRDTLRFVEHLITGDGDDHIEGGPVAERLEPRGGVDTVLAGGGGDELVTNDGVADVISCGQDGAEPEPRDFLSADLADILDAGNQQRLFECELFEAAAVGQLPNVKILTERLRITGKRRTRIQLGCPAAVNTRSCAGRLTLTHAEDGKQLAGRRYRLAKGACKAVVLRLSREDFRWLKHGRKALVTAAETDPAGRPKTTGASCWCSCAGRRMTNDE